MTLLRGHFAMTLICAGTATDHEVETALKPLTADGVLVTTVRGAPPEPPGSGAGVSYLLTVHGADRLGIVATVTRVLAGYGGNITDLTTRLTGSLYLLSAEVDFPSTVDVEDVVDRLDEVSRTLRIRISLRPAEADVL